MIYAVIHIILILVKPASIAIIDAFILMKSATARTFARMELTRVIVDAARMSSFATLTLDCHDVTHGSSCTVFYGLKASLLFFFVCTMYGE